MKPHILQQMMRHADLKTTMTFYVSKDADEVAAAIWDAIPRDQLTLEPDAVEN